MRKTSEEDIIWFNRLVSLGYSSLDCPMQKMRNLNMHVGDAIDVYSICFPNPIHSVFWTVTYGQIARLFPLQALN